MVSQGPPPEEIRVRVPLLIGYSLQEAAEILRAAGLYAGQLREQLSRGGKGDHRAGSAG
jgi:beta-lactam-binding protein with PASTA domain